MPFIDILPSTSLKAEVSERDLIGRVSNLAARHLGKPQAYLMVRVSPASTMTFAESVEPTCFVDVRLIGMPNPDAAKALNEALCAEIEAAFGIPRARTFVVFTDVPRAAWGVGGRMLG